MWKVFKYTMFDLVRSRWMIIYMSFFLVLTFSLLIFSNDFTKVIVSLMNIVLVLTPLVGILVGVLYCYNSEEFIRLLMAQPVSRRSIISGLYFGMATSFCMSLLIGIGLPMFAYGILSAPEFPIFLVLCGVAMFLSIIFSLIAFNIALKFKNKLKGFGYSIFIWLMFAILYDGLFLILLLAFKDYPLENLTLILTALNPIDLGRILIMFQLDISAIMGYTGASLKQVMGSRLGTILILGVLVIWILLPYLRMRWIAAHRDF